MKKLVIAAALGALLAVPQASPAKVRPGMLALGIAGSVMVVAGVIGGLSCWAVSGGYSDAADLEWSNSYDPGYFDQSRNGHYYSSQGISDLNQASGWLGTAEVFGVVGVLGIPTAIIGFANLRDPDAVETPRQRRRRRYRDEGRLSPLLDVEDGQLMALTPDIQPLRNGGARASLLSVQF
jgi:hypothetical protein